jgi:hypothetical protein
MGIFSHNGSCDLTEIWPEASLNISARFPGIFSAIKVFPFLLVGFACPRLYSDASLMSHITRTTRFSIRGSSGPSPSNLLFNQVATFCLSNLNFLMNTFPCSCETQMIHKYNKWLTIFDVQRM